MAEKLSLDIDQDVNFEKKTWKVHKGAFIGMGLFVLLSLLGLLGKGILSEAATGEKSGELFVEYNRFGRMIAPYTIDIIVNKPNHNADSLVLQLDRNYMSDIEVKQVIPPPRYVQYTPEFLNMVFSTEKGESYFSISLDLTCKKSGSIQCRIKTPGGKEVSFNQFFYP